MNQMKRRLTAILLALFQIMSVITPGSFAAAEGGQEIVTGQINVINNQPLFYVYVDGSGEDLSALGENDYIIIKRFSARYPECYAYIPLKDINSAGYARINDNEDFVTARGRIYEDPNGKYEVRLAHISGVTSPDFSELQTAFGDAGKTFSSGGKQYITSITGDYRGDISIQLDRQTDAFDVGITFQDQNGNTIPAPAVDGHYYLIALDAGDDVNFSAANVATLPSDTYCISKSWRVLPARLPRPLFPFPDSAM